jgi:dTDP-4-amino-4,6-dideoxygalactose transaminase
MERIPHSRPTLPTREEWPQITGRLAPGWAADGPCTDEFAARAAARLNCKFGTVVNSGTSALHLALLGAGVRPGQEVMVPAYCCAALLNAVALAGAAPVLVDCAPGGYNASPDDAARKLTPRTAAIVVAHMFGTPAPLDGFLALGPPVIEDCAQSIGGACGGRGLLAIGSFYATKVITTGHGGIVATSDPELAERLRDLTHYDNRDDWRPRFNYGLGETAAALGLWQLERLDSFLERRAEIRFHYNQAVGIPEAAFDGIAYRYVMQVRDASAAIQAMDSLGIDVKRPVYAPLHHYLGGVAPHAQAAHEQIVSLPIYPLLSERQVTRVAEVATRTLGGSLIGK